LINGSVGATVSEYMETCFQEHIPEDVDLVVIELAINDRRMECLAKSYENLIRALRVLPTIINLQVSSSDSVFHRRDNHDYSLLDNGPHVQVSNSRSLRWK